MSGKFHASTVFRGSAQVADPDHLWPRRPAAPRGLMRVSRGAAFTPNGAFASTF